MSYRELRNFTEIMRALGYPRLISMENFRTPNFELVADILYWMVKLYDPDTTITDRVEFENERVEFLTSIASLLAAKARLKLNTKKLYASDGRAVQELLKLASLLYQATRAKNSKNEGLKDDSTPPPPIKMQDVKVARTLASEITQSGAKLYDLLADEVKERQERLRALRFLDSVSVAAENSREAQETERRVREIIEQRRNEVEDTKKEVEELEADQRTLQVKISKRREELERTEKRLKSLEHVKPQFLEEAEKLEKELSRYYEVYIDKLRNLQYLEFSLDQYRIAEEEQKRENDLKLARMRERLLKEEVELMRGGSAGDRDKGERNGGGGGGGGGGTSLFAQYERDTKGDRDRDDRGRRDRDRDREESEEEEDDEDEDSEELSVNERFRVQNASSGANRGGGGGGGGGGQGGGRGGAPPPRRDFLDDDDDEDEDDEDDEEDLPARRNGRDSAGRDRGGGRGRSRDEEDFSGSDDF